MTRPAPINSGWRFSLRTLLIVLLVAPPLLSIAWVLWQKLTKPWEPPVIEFVDPPAKVEAPIR